MGVPGRSVRRWLLAVLFVAASLGAGDVGYHLADVNGRGSYRTLEPDVYFPTFFARYAVAREHHAGWLTDAASVALAYVGRSRVCPNQQAGQLSATDDRVVFLITRTCPYSAAIVRQFRVDLVHRNGNWEIEWAGMRLKCAVNRSWAGAYLIGHNPFRGWRAPWAASWSNAVISFANSINPWMSECL